MRTANTKLLTLKVWPLIPPTSVPFVYDVDVFCAKNWSNGELLITEKTVCIHHYACSWNRKKKSLKQRITEIIGGLQLRYITGAKI